MGRKEASFLGVPLLSQPRAVHVLLPSVPSFLPAHFRAQLRVPGPFGAVGFESQSQPLCHRPALLLTLAPMDTPQAVPSRPSLLQLLRGLFGYHRSALGTQGPRAEHQEPGTTRDPSGSQGERVSPAHREPGGQQRPYWEPLGDVEKEGTELLLGELQELSLEGSLGSSRSCLSSGTSDKELEVAGDGQEAPAGSGAQQDAAGGVASAEAFGDKALKM